MAHTSTYPAFGHPLPPPGGEGRVRGQRATGARRCDRRGRALCEEQGEGERERESKSHSPNVPIPTVCHLAHCLLISTRMSKGRKHRKPQSGSAPTPTQSGATISAPPPSALVATRSSLARRIGLQFAAILSLS